MTTPTNADLTATSTGYTPVQGTLDLEIWTCTDASVGIIGKLPAVPSHAGVDPLAEYVGSLPTEITDPSRQVSRPIADENATTHGSKTLAEFTQLKVKEKNGKLLPGEAEYFRYGTKTSRALELEIAKNEQGEAAVVFKSANAAVTGTLEALLPLTPNRLNIVATKEWNDQMTEYFRVAAPPGGFHVSVSASHELDRLDSCITSATAVVMLGTIANETSPEQLALFIKTQKLKNPNMKFFADRCGQRQVQSPLASGVNLILPPLNEEPAVNCVALGAVVGEKALINRIADIRGQIGTIASDAECEGTITARFNSHRTPLTEQAERELAVIEKGEAALLFRSGMAAIHAFLLHIIQRKDDKPVHLIVGSEGYRQTLNIILDRLRPRNEVEVSVIPMVDFAKVGEYIKENTAAIFFETPSNPFLNVTSVRQVADEVTRVNSGALVVVDHTFASAFNQTPLMQGADVVIPSLTKYIGGTNQVAAGAIVGPRSFIGHLERVRSALGSIASDRDCQGVIDGLKTLPERMSRANRNGLHVAQILERHADVVKKVWYPGLCSHPDHQVAKKQMIGGFGGVVSFELNTNSMFDIEAFVDAFIKASSKNTFIGPSFGGEDPLISVVTVVSHFKQTLEERAQRGIPLSLVRLSVGTGNPEELTAGLQAGFEAFEERRKRPVAV